MERLEGMTVDPYGEDYMKPAFLSLVDHLSKTEDFSKFVSNLTPEELNEQDQKKVFGMFADWVALNRWGLDGQ